jgi:hypothetical protein
LKKPPRASSLAPQQATSQPHLEAGKQQPKRRRHYAFVLANEETKKIYHKDILQHILSYAKDYINDVKDKVIVLENEALGKALVLPYITRFSLKYVSRVLAKLIAYKTDLMNFRDYNIKITHIVLTIKPEDYVSLNMAYKYLRQAQHRVLMALRKRYGKENILGYIFVPELGRENHRLHGHLLVFHTSEWISTELVYKSSKVGGVKLKRYRSISYGIRYISKYIVKYQLALKENANLEETNLALMSMAVVWSLNGRCYSYSRLQLFLNYPRTIETSEGNWVFMGSFPLSEFANLMGLRDFDEVHARILELFIKK